MTVKQLAIAYLILILISGFLPGCISPSEAGSFAESQQALSPQFLPPAFGDWAHYIGDNLNLTIRVQGPREVMVSGERAELAEVDYLMQRDLQNRTATSKWSEFLSGAGRKWAVLSECQGLGRTSFWNLSDCDTADRWSGSSMEAGTPGFLGSSWIWRDSLRPGNVTFSYGALNVVHPVTYDVDDLGDGCFSFSADEVPDFSGQRFSPLATPPLKMKLCSGSPWPLEVKYEKFPGRLRLMRAGSDGNPEIPAVDDAYPVPHADPRATKVIGSIPAGSSSDPTVLSTAEAWEFFWNESEQADMLRKKDNIPVLEHTKIVGGGTTRLQWPFPEIVVSEHAERRLSVGSRSGAAVEVLIRKECHILTGCETSLQEESGVLMRHAFDNVEFRSVPADELLRETDSYFPSGVEFYGVGAVSREIGKPDLIPGDRFLYEFFALEDGRGVGHAYKVQVDSLTAEVLSFDIPTENTGALRGWMGELVGQMAVEPRD